MFAKSSVQRSPISAINSKDTRVLEASDAIYLPNLKHLDAHIVDSGENAMSACMYSRLFHYFFKVFLT